MLHVFKVGASMSMLYYDGVHMRVWLQMELVWVSWQ